MSENADNIVSSRCHRYLLVCQKWRFSQVFLLTCWHIANYSITSQIFRDLKKKNAFSAKLCFKVVLMHQILWTIISNCNRNVESLKKRWICSFNEVGEGQSPSVSSTLLTHPLIAPTCSEDHNGRTEASSDSLLRLIFLLEVPLLKRNRKKWKVLTSHPAHNGTLKPLSDPVGPPLDRWTCMWTQWYRFSSQQRLLLFLW